MAVTSHQAKKAKNDVIRKHFALSYNLYTCNLGICACCRPGDFSLDQQVQQTFLLYGDQPRTNMPNGMAFG